MARVYQITEEEMHSLIQQLEIASLKECNICFRDDKDYDKPATMKDTHRAFHFVVTRWAQSMGFTMAGR